MLRPARRLLLALGAAALWLHPRPAVAQAPVDSAALAKAVARFIAAEVIPGFSDEPRAVIGPVRTHFDSLVAREMALLPEFRGPARKRARPVEIETRGLATLPGASPELSELPAILIRVSGCTRSEDGDEWYWWANESYYVFKQTEPGWKVVWKQTLSDADGTCLPADSGEKP